MYNDESTKCNHVTDVPRVVYAVADSMGWREKHDTVPSRARQSVLLKRRANEKWTERN